VRMRAIAGKNLPPVDAGAGVGVWSWLFRVVCCLLLGCMTCALVQVVTDPLVPGIGGRPPTGRLR
jgi:hypothetical protein